MYLNKVHIEPLKKQTFSIHTLGYPLPYFALRLTINNVFSVLAPSVLILQK